jgi:hypothetical protein
VAALETLLDSVLEGFKPILLRALVSAAGAERVGTEGADGPASVRQGSKGVARLSTRVALPSLEARELEIEVRVSLHSCGGASSTTPDREATSWSSSALPRAGATSPAVSSSSSPLDLTTKTRLLEAVAARPGKLFEISTLARAVGQTELLVRFYLDGLRARGLVVQTGARWYRVPPESCPALKNLSAALANEAPEKPSSASALSSVQRRATAGARIGLRRTPKGDARVAEPTIAERVVHALERQGGLALGPAVLATDLGVKPCTIRPLLSRMVRRREVVRIDDGVYALAPKAWAGARANHHVDELWAGGDTPVRRREGDDASTIDRIVALLRGHPGGLRAGAIRAHLDLPANEWLATASRALAGKKIRKVGQKRGTTYFADLPADEAGLLLRGPLPAM